MLYRDSIAVPKRGSLGQAPSRLGLAAQAISHGMRPMLGRRIDPQLKPLPGQRIMFEQGRAGQHRQAGKKQQGPFQAPRPRGGL